MNTYKRFGNRWTVNECLQLQREHELLEWTIDEIAIKHKRTPTAIMYKIVKEEFDNYDLLSSYLFCKNDDKEEEKYIQEEKEEDQEKKYDIESDKGSDKEDELNDLKNHVKSLENKMLSIIELLVSQSKNKNAALYQNFF